MTNTLFRKRDCHVSIKYLFKMSPHTVSLLFKSCMIISLVPKCFALSQPENTCSKLTRTRCEICSKFTLKTPGRRQIPFLVTVHVSCAPYPRNIYLLKVNDRNTRERCEICSKLTINTPQRRL